MPVPRTLIAIVVLSVVGACARHVSPRPAQASSTSIADTTLFYAASVCQAPKDSLTATRDSASLAACQLRNERPVHIKIF